MTHKLFNKIAILFLFLVALGACTLDRFAINPDISTAQVKTLTPDWAPTEGGTAAVLDLSGFNTQFGLLAYGTNLAAVPLSSVRTEISATMDERVIPPGTQVGFEVTSITFCGKEALSAKTVPDSTEKVAIIMPANPGGYCDVVVTGTLAGQAIRRSNVVQYINGPSLSNIETIGGSVFGGTKVIINGKNLSPGDQVSLGSAPCDIIQINGGEQIICWSGKYAPGVVNVTVVRPQTGQRSELPNAYRYAFAPTIISSSASSGLPNDSITLQVINLQSGAKMEFGSVQPAVTSSGPISLSFNVPGILPGLANVVVVNPDGQKSNPMVFTVLNSPLTPVISSINPNTLPSSLGGNVIVSGNNFDNDAIIAVDGTPATVISRSQSSITVQVNPHAAGAVEVKVTNPSRPGNNFSAISNGLVFRDAPTVLAASLAMINAGGGESLTLTGTGFLPGATVQFISAEPNLPTLTTFNSPSSITLLTPATTPGTVSIRVTNPDGQFGDLPGGIVSYLFFDLDISVTSVTPNSGSVLGGTAITISGAGFANPSVKVGGSDCAVSASNAGSISCTTGPSAFIGAVDVVVINSIFQQAILTGAFSYTAAMCTPAPRRDDSAPPTLATAVTESNVAEHAGTSDTGYPRMFGANFGGASFAQSEDGQTANWQTIPYSQSDYLNLMGYYELPAFNIPSGAVIDGIKVNCKWRAVRYSGDDTYVSSLRLLKAGIPVGANRGADLCNALPSTLSLSDDYGADNDLWGASFTPADINDSGFGVQIQLEGGMDVEAYIDYCKLRVYWHQD